jgi:hypothetical protein
MLWLDHAMVRSCHGSVGAIPPVCFRAARTHSNCILCEGGASARSRLQSVYRERETDGQTDRQTDRQRESRPVQACRLPVPACRLQAHNMAWSCCCGGSVWVCCGWMAVRVRVRVGRCACPCVCVCNRPILCVKRTAESPSVRVSGACTGSGCALCVCVRERERERESRWTSCAGPRGLSGDGWAPVPV